MSVKEGIEEQQQVTPIYSEMELMNGERKELIGNCDNEKSATSSDKVSNGTDLYVVCQREPGSDVTQGDTSLIYKISDSVPIHLNLFFGLQQVLVSLSSTLTVVLLVSQAVCAESQEEIKTRLASSSLFMNGITTLCMVTLGVRLPLFQGATTLYVMPLLAMADIDKDRCSTARFTVFNSITNQTEFSESLQEQTVLSAVQNLQGALIAAGTVHFLIGATGVMGVLLRFIGPITIVPAILLVGFYLIKPAAKYAQVNWGISIATTALALILSLYLHKLKMPMPAWSKKRSFHIIRFPLHNACSILIAVTFGWILCLILTVSGAFNMDDKHKDFYARTDARSNIIEKANWFTFPYPGQFGPIGFSTSAFVGFLVATFISILDSVGDYYACASMCRVPPPPSHGVNRGIAVEGLCTVLSGFLGCGHATTTYGGNIGAIGLTKVASRSVFMTAAIIVMVMGIMGKISAVLITMPYPVVGGMVIVIFGTFIGLLLSILKVIDLSSTRNLVIIGISLFVGLMLPYWVGKYDGAIDTGNKEADDIIRMLLGNPNLAGGVLACFLDNTVPGTPEERGLTVWRNMKRDNQMVYSEGIDVYNPLCFQRYKSWKILQYLPFMPNPVQDQLLQA